MTKGAFRGDISANSIGTSCSFSQAVKEAVSLGLTEKDPTHDLGNEYTARVMMVLAKELGLDRNVSMEKILSRSEKITEIPYGEKGDYRVFEAKVDKEIKERVSALAQRGLVLRHVASIDVASQSIDVKIVEVPSNHVFALTPPTCECVRFFTDRYQPYPLVVQGPAAGADCTSSALLAEVLSLMSNKIGPRSGVLSRTGSSAYLS
jgi:homoserine dehydrogenase